LPFDAKAEALLKPEARALLGRLVPRLSALPAWNLQAIDAETKAFAEAEAKKLGDVAQPMRAALTGRTVSPGVFEVLVALGKDEGLARLKAQVR
jgi:glutamyl-tRNA synthetase